jgi:uncharacterized protein YjiS (DUF1127 family)
MALMVDIFSAPSAVGRVLASVGRVMLRSIIAGRLRQVARTLRHRREAETLAGLDEYMLADIGLNRADLRDAFSGPLWRDPTSVLGQRADERRIRAHAPTASWPSARSRASPPAFTAPGEGAARRCV